MRLCWIFLLPLYWDNNSALAVDNGEINIGLTSELKAEIDRRVSSVVSSLTERYENEISEIKTELGQQKQRIEKLEANELVYMSILANYQNDSELLESDTEGVVEAVAEDVASIDGSTPARKLQHRIARSREGTSRIRRNVEHQVAFFASVTPNLSNLGIGQDFVFDHVVTNLGNAYNGHHGTFVAPVAGTYVFSVTLQANLALRTWGHFMVNGNILAKLNLTEDNQVSQSIIVVLKPGDDVSVQNTDANKGILGDRYSTFSGFLLYEDFAILLE